MTEGESLAERYFLDTNVILRELQQYSSTYFLLSSETLIEIEKLKTDKNKTEDVRAAARIAARWLAEHHGEYEVIHYVDGVYETLFDFRVAYLEEIPDIKICVCAWKATQQYPNDKIIFVTHDLSCRNIAENIFGLDVEWFEKTESDCYKGFKELSMSNDEMAYFYEHQDENTYGLLTNQYLILKDSNGEIVDSYRWDGELFQPLYKKQIKSIYFDKLKPKDIYQSCVVDSIINNTITAISGKPGTGKSLISLAVIENLIETGKTYDRFVCLFNPIKARGTADLGYYAGDFLSKAMLNSVGNILTTKYGDRYAVDVLLSQEKLKLISMADCRGMEITDNEILYIPEAENTSVDMMKLCLSRVSSGAKVIIEGDPESQVDSYLYEGKNNGLLRVIDKFKGHSEFGYIQLQNVWRSRIAELTELL